MKKLGLILLFGCTPAGDPAVEVRATGTVLDIQADQPFLRARWRNPSGLLVEERHLPVALDHLALPAIGPQQGTLELDFQHQTWTKHLDLQVRPDVPPSAPVAGQIRLVSSVFPSDRDGLPVPGVTDGALLLSPPGWTELMRVVPVLGVRPSDPEIPRAWHGVVLHNQGTHPGDVAVTLRILGDDDRPDPAFSARVRGAPTDQVTALVRVPPAATVRVALPVWVDESAISTDLRRTWREVTVTAPGQQLPLASSRAPLAARRSGWIPGLTSATTVVLSLIGLSGLAALATRGLPRWPLLDQAYIAMFAALLVLVGLSGQLIGSAVLAVLGPFAIFLTAVVDDALRTSVLLALLHLCRRPGAVALTVATAWLARSALFGGFTLLDAVHAGSQVFWLETSLLVVGAYHGKSIRLIQALIALPFASLFATAGALALQVTWMRLWLDPWFIAAWLLGPAGLYVVAAVALAWRPARALREVA